MAVPGGKKVPPARVGLLVLAGVVALYFLVTVVSGLFR